MSQQWYFYYHHNLATQTKSNKSGTECYWYGSWIWSFKYSEHYRCIHNISSHLSQNSWLHVLLVLSDRGSNCISSSSIQPEQIVSSTVQTAASENPSEDKQFTISGLFKLGLQGLLWSVGWCGCLFQMSFDCSHFFHSFHELIKAL